MFLSLVNQTANRYIFRKLRQCSSYVCHSDVLRSHIFSGTYVDIVYTYILAPHLHIHLFGVCRDASCSCSFSCISCSGTFPDHSNSLISLYFQYNEAYGYTKVPRAYRREWTLFGNILQRRNFQI